MFRSCDDPVRRDEITRSMTAMPQHTMVSAMQGILGQTTDTLGRVEQPFLLIPAGAVPIPTDALREVIPNLRTAQTYGSGHFSMLEVPDQINAMIERFIALEVVSPA